MSRCFYEHIAKCEVVMEGVLKIFSSVKKASKFYCTIKGEGMCPKIFKCFNKYPPPPHSRRFMTAPLYILYLRFMFCYIFLIYLYVYYMLLIFFKYLYLILNLCDIFFHFHYMYKIVIM